MNELKSRAAILITLALVGVLVNIIMFKAGVGSWLVVIITVVLAGYGLWTLRQSRQ